MKGLGEVGIVGAGAAIANAVFNATGARVRELPITLDKLLPGLPPTWSAQARDAMGGRQSRATPPHPL
jgi:hypothetical protein